MFHVVIVDDEKELLYSLKIILESEGWRVSVYSEAVPAMESFKETLPDIIIMDIVMSGEDGIWLCRKVREVTRTVPILFLSAKVEEIDKIAGLESGADDYLGKPFSARELIARIRVQKRRQDALQDRSSDGDPFIHLDGFSLGKESMTLEYHSDKVSLTLSEYRVLEFLMNRPERICSREELLNVVYKEDTYVCDRVIDNHIKRLRSKIQQLSKKERQCIDTVYGVGYCWRKL